MLECTEDAWLPWMHVIKKYAEAETKKARLSWGGPNALKKDLILYREAGRNGGKTSVAGYGIPSKPNVALIIEMLQEGFTPTEIAEELDVKRINVYQIRRRYKLQQDDK